jgi:hypothetical protein
MFPGCAVFSLIGSVVHAVDVVLADLHLLALLRKQRRAVAVQVEI